MNKDSPQITIYIEIINQTHSTSKTKTTDPKIYRKVNSLTNTFIKQLKQTLKELEKPTLTKKKK